MRDSSLMPSFLFPSFRLFVFPLISLFGLRFFIPSFFPPHHDMGIIGQTPQSRSQVVL